MHTNYKSEQIWKHSILDLTTDNNINNISNNN